MKILQKTIKDKKKSYINLDGNDIFFIEPSTKSGYIGPLSKNQTIPLHTLFTSFIPTKATIPPQLTINDLNLELDLTGKLYLFTLKVEEDEHAFNLEELIGILGSKVDKTLLPSFHVGLKEVNFNHETQEFFIHGIVISGEKRVEVQLDLQILAKGKRTNRITVKS